MPTDAVTLLPQRDHMSYDIDRVRLPKEQAEPSLSEMALAALRTLDAAARRKRSKQGFFLMIEGSRIGQLPLLSS